MRYPYCDLQSGLSKGSWSAEEDRKLINYINNYGISNWNKMSSSAGLARTGKSCRLRWMNYLNPITRRGNFTEEEDKTILRLHALLGNRWSKIARELSGRSDNEIKNRYHTHLKKRIIKIPMTKPEEITKSDDLEDLEDVESSIKSSVVEPDDPLFSSTYSDISSRSDNEQQKVEFEETICYDIPRSPGTIQDFESFRQQLYFANYNDEDLELQYFLQDTTSDEEFFIDNSYNL